jgi:hypothetical protein
MSIHKRTTLLISGIRLTYKFVIPDTKKIIFFLFFWNIDLASSHGFNKLVIKAQDTC